MGGAGTSDVWLAVKDIDFRLEARDVEGLGGRDVPPLIIINTSALVREGMCYIVG